MERLYNHELEEEAGAALKDPLPGMAAPRGQPENNSELARLQYVWFRILNLAVGLWVLLAAAKEARGQARVSYMGGTPAQIQAGSSGAIDLTDDHYLAFYSKKIQVRVAYDRVDLLEYGQQVDRRLLLAVVISPAFMLSKKRKHFLTIGYTDEDGKQQAMVFEVDKHSVRSALASLEARTGRKIEFQDEEARKAGRG